MKLENGQKIGRVHERAEGPAKILAIGTATPFHWVDQTSYPDYYFKVTNNEHLVDLKEKFRRICKLYFPLTLHVYRCYLI